MAGVIYLMTNVAMPGMGKSSLVKCWWTRCGVQLE